MLLIILILFFKLTKEIKRGSEGGGDSMPSKT